MKANTCAPQMWVCFHLFRLHGSGVYSSWTSWRPCQEVPRCLRPCLLAWTSNLKCLERVGGWVGGTSGRECSCSGIGSRTPKSCSRIKTYRLCRVLKLALAAASKKTHLLLRGPFRESHRTGTCFLKVFPGVQPPLEQRSAQFR